MPCNCDYMEPTAFELRILEAAGLLAYVLTATNRDVPAEIAQLAAGKRTHQIDRKTGDAVVARLCSELHDLDPLTHERLVYHTRTKESRRLADWWEEHLAADKAREGRENKAKLDRGYLFPKGSGVPSAKKDQMLEWYNRLGSEGQSYVNLLLLVRDSQAKKVTHVSKD